MVFKEFHMLQQIKLNNLAKVLAKNNYQQLFTIKILISDKYIINRFRYRLF